MDNQFPLPSPSTPNPLQQPVPDSGFIAPLPIPEEAPPPPANYAAPASETPPQSKSSPLKIILPILGAVLVIGLIIFLALKLFSGDQAQPSASIPSPKNVTTLTYWGLWEPASVMTALIADFEAQNPGIKINYMLQDPPDYQDRALSALDSADVPDIIRLHTTWLPLFAQKLSISATNTVSAAEMENNFPRIVNDLLVVNKQVFGVPLTVDGLGLYVNTAMFQQRSLDMPTTWNDVLTAAKTLKEVDPLTGKITRAGIALGNTTNVDHWPDIVTLMLLQAGVKLVSLQDYPTETEATLSFYTDFVTKNRVWDDTMPTSTVAFANEKVAMILAPLWRAPEIKQINPTLAWKILPVPQLPKSDTVNWASIWFEAVPKNAKHPTEAWKFLKYLASANAQQKLFEAAAKDREFPQAPANKSLLSVAQANPYVSSYMTSMDTARSFYTAADTKDASTSLNARMIKYLEDAVNGVTRRQEIAATIETLAKGFNQVLSEYGLVKVSPAPAP